MNQAELPRSRFLANIVTILGGQFGTIAVAVLTEVCVARLLGPASRGQISLCTMAIWFGAVLGGMGGEVPIVIWSASLNKKFSEWISVILLWGGAGCVATVLLWAFVYGRWHSSTLQGVTPDLAWLVSISIPPAILFSYLIALLMGTERFGQRATVTLLRSVTGLAGFLSLVAFDRRNSSAALWGNWLGVAFGIVVASFFLRDAVHSKNWSVPKFGKEIRSGLLIGLRGQLGPLTTFFTYRLDVFVVNYFFNPTQVGIYAVGVAVSESLWQIPQAVAVALFPRTARTAQENAAAFTCLILRQVLLISCVSAAVIALASPLAIPLVFGARFAGAVAVILWLLPGTVALSMAKVSSADLGGRGKTGYASFFGVACFVVTVVLDLALIPRWGIQGAAVASSVAYMVMGILFLAALRHELKVGWGEMLVPSRAELARYKEAGFGTLARLRPRRGSSPVAVPLGPESSIYGSQSEPRGSRETKTAS